MLRSADARQTRVPEEKQAHEVAFDFVLDGWDQSAAQLQMSGDLILVALPRGFYGGIVVPRVEDWSGIVTRLCR